MGNCGSSSNAAVVVEQGGGTKSKTKPKPSIKAFQGTVGFSLTFDILLLFAWKLNLFLSGRLCSLDRVIDWVLPTNYHSSRPPHNHHFKRIPLLLPMSTLNQSLWILHYPVTRDSDNEKLDWPQQKNDTSIPKRYLPRPKRNRQFHSKGRIRSRWWGGASAG